VLSVGPALLGRFVVPLRRLGIALRHALTLLVHCPELVLAESVALLGRLAEPLHGLSIVPRLLPQTFAAHGPEGGLGCGEALLGRFVVPLRRLGVALPHALTFLV